MAQNTAQTAKPGNKGTRDMWTVACVDAGMDCSFRLTTHNQKELTTFAINHLKTVHNLTKTEKDVLALAKGGKY